MRSKTPNRESAEERAVRCLAYGIAHAHAAFGPERLTTILGTIALDFAASADTTPAASSGTPVKSDAGVTFE